MAGIRAAARATYDRALNDFDALLMPTTPKTAPLLPSPDASPEAIAAHLKLDVDDVSACLRTMTSRGVSINKPVGDENGATIGSIIPSGAIRQDVAMERTQNSESIATALESFASTLKPAHAEILRGRVIAGLTGDDQRCAKTFGVSKQRVGQIEKQLREKLASHFTRSFGADGVKAMLRASF